MRKNEYAERWKKYNMMQRNMRWLGWEMRGAGAPLHRAGTDGNCSDPRGSGVEAAVPEPDHDLGMRCNQDRLDAGVFLPLQADLVL